MTWATDLAADVAEVLGDTEGPAEACRYVGQRGKGRPVPIRAVLHRRQFDEQATDAERLVVGQATCIVSRADVPVAMAGDELRVTMPDGKTEELWRVDSVKQESTAARMLEIRRTGTRTMLGTDQQRDIQ